MSVLDVVDAELLWDTSRNIANLEGNSNEAMVRGIHSIIISQYKAAKKLYEIGAMGNVIISLLCSCCASNIYYLLTGKSKVFLDKTDKLDKSIYDLLCKLHIETFKQYREWKSEKTKLV